MLGKNRKSKKSVRQRRALRTRSKIKELDRLRLCVYRSNNNIYAQVIDPSGNVRVSASSIDKDLRGKCSGGNKEGAKAVGQLVAERAKQAGCGENIAFDRSGYQYHGRVKELAEAAREAGLKF